MKLYFLFIVLIVFSSCTSNDFKIMQPSGNNPGVTLEAKIRRGLFGKSGGFEIKLINTSNYELKNCKLEFNNKFSYPVIGLHSKEKGIIKSDVFMKGDTITIPFTDEVDNIIFFNVPKEGFKAETVRLICNECNVEWKLE